MAKDCTKKVVKWQPDVEHWHAATPETGVTYLAITGNQRTNWLEKLPEELFEKINLDSIKNTIKEEEIINLSKNKWQWMSDKNMDKLDELFHEKSVFVHMGGSWGKEREIELLRVEEFIIRKPIFTRFQ